jgi:mRNA-degrading endonuclease RelE of RelBE toxin-antitoxin system
MPNESGHSVHLNYTPEFKRGLRALSRKYRHIRPDFQPAVDQLLAGEIIGDQIPGTRYTVFKLRVRNSDISRGKSAGYRLIYYLETSTSITLVTIYSKLDQGDISPQQIRRILQEFGDRQAL